MATETPHPIAHYPYMTDVPGRNIKVKVHKTIGQAKNAILGSHPRDTALIYQWDSVADAWAVLFEVEPGTPKDQMPWVAQEPRQFEAQQTTYSRRTIRVMARNSREAQQKYLAGEWDATDWIEDGDGLAWGWQESRRG
jgi:hypothetical protein